jgi:hypothetical protein
MRAAELLALASLIALAPHLNKYSAGLLCFVYFVLAILYGKGILV